MAKNPYSAYQNQSRQNLSGREIEARAFTKAARLLEDAKSSMAEGDAKMDALRFNTVLWTIIQADVTEPSNRLPSALKANIISLSLFVDRHTKIAMTSKDPAILDALININRNIAAGLGGIPSEAAAASAPERGPSPGPGIGDSV